MRGFCGCQLWRRRWPGVVDRAGCIRRCYSVLREKESSTGERASSKDARGERQRREPGLILDSLGLDRDQMLN
jgi:hypothetical protein